MKKRELLDKTYETYESNVHAEVGIMFGCSKAKQFESPTTIINARYEKFA